MGITKDKVLKEALELTPIERAQLIEDVLDSFNFPLREEIDKAWAEEAESRIDAFNKGELTERPIEEVFESINKMNM